MTYPDRSECDFTLRGRFGESIGVPATSACVYPACVDPPGVPCVCMEEADRADAVSAPVTAISSEREGDGWITCAGRPDAAHGARVAIHRATKDAREARDALNRFLSSLDALREALE